MDKSLEELRAAIENDQAEASESDVEEVIEEAGTQNEVESEEVLDASPEITSDEDSSADPDEDPSEEEQWVVPGRFRTNDDVIKAYSELESFTGKQSSEIQKLRHAIVEPPRSGESTDEKTARLKRFADELAIDPEKALEVRMRSILDEGKQEVKAKEFELAYDARKNDKNSDFAELEPVMTQIATQYQDMIVQNNLSNDPRLLDILHLAARGARSEELASKAESEGIKRGKKLSKQKGKVRLESPNGTQKKRKLDSSKLSAAQMKEAFEKGDLDVNE